MSQQSQSHLQSESSKSQDASVWRFILVVGCTFVALLLVANTSMPWEGDQPAKAAQVMDLAATDNYFLAGDIVDHYRLRLFPFYYSMSALLFKVVGGNLFAFMNLTSVVFGVIAMGATVIALHRALRVPYAMTLVVMLSIPMFIVNSTYGNEVAWSFAFLAIFLAATTFRERWIRVAAGVVVALALFCRPDVVLVFPFLLGWLLIHSPRDETEKWWHTLIHPILGASVAALTLWLCLLRNIPETITSFPFEFNLKLLIAYLSYPFNPSVVMLSVPGFFLLFRKSRPYALVHLLLLVPVAFYAGNLSTPKYVTPLIWFYAIPVAILLNEVTRLLQVLAFGAIAFWFFFAVTLFGVFGPQKAELWYLPTADGPCPTGGYLSFYSCCKAGVYQQKQIQNLKQMEVLYDYVLTADDHLRAVGHTPHVMAGYVHVTRGKDRDTWDRVNRMIRESTPNDRNVLMTRNAYTNLSKTIEPFGELALKWIKNGQIRAVSADDESPFPLLIELGDHLDPQPDLPLAKRLLFANDHYSGLMIFELEDNVHEYKATTWVKTGTGEKSQESEPIYEDDEFFAYEKDTLGGTSFGYVWPSRYHKLGSAEGKR